MPTCFPSRAPELTTARTSPVLLISASSSSARNAVLPPAAVAPAPLMVVATPYPFDHVVRSIVDRRRAAGEAVTAE